jgi:hypothetical protein
VEVIMSLGGSLCDEMHLKEELPPRPNITYTEQQLKEEKEKIHKKLLLMDY